MTTDPAPLLSRIVMATIVSADLDATAALYDTWLGYRVVEKAVVSEGLAQSWGAPACAGRRLIVMASNTADAAYIRAVEGTVPAGYRSLQTWGWNAIEIIVADVEALSEKLADSPFRLIAPPEPLTSYPSIVAMQVEGPSREVLYLTMQTDYSGDNQLPRPSAFVGRPFIAVLAGPDMDTMLDWYAASFALPRRLSTKVPIGLLAREQGLDESHEYPIATMRLGEAGNLIEFDEYPAGFGARHRPDGQLPPGIAMFSFASADLDAIGPAPIAPPRSHDGMAYGGRRAMTLTGPAGELVEIIET